MHSTQTFEGATHVARYSGREIFFTEFSYEEACSKLIAEMGGDGSGLVVDKIEEPKSSPIAEAVKALPDYSDVATQPVAVGEINVEAKARIERDTKLAESLGFSLPRPLYDTGSQATGLDHRRAEFEELGSAREEARSLARLVEAEERHTVMVEAASVRMARDGQLVLGRETNAERIRVTERGFPRLCQRLGMPNGAGTYLSGVWPNLRALNVNHWGAHLDQEQDEARVQHEEAQLKKPFAKRAGFEPQLVSLRTRASGAHREVFAAVGDGYPEFDVNLIADAIQVSVPADARADAVYDGYKMRFDALWFTDVPGDQGAAGEVFKAGVRVRTDDTGGGSVRVDAIVWRNLCLNFIIIGTAKQSIASIRHLGSVAELARKFQQAFKKALATVEAFRTQWGYASGEEVLPAALDVSRKLGVEGVPEEGPIPLSVALPWLFNGALDRELAVLPRRNRAQTIDDLVRMWNKEPARQVTRANFVNAVTRYAHEVNTDPFFAHDIESAAGQMLYSKAPLSLRPLEA